ncbi:MAG: PPC domain-containing protein [Pirellulaceae bacterium]
MKTLSRIALAISFGLACSSAAEAQTSYPMLMSLDPVAAQVGRTSEHSISSRYSMYGAYQVVVSGEGVTGEVVMPEEKEEKQDAKESEKNDEQKAPPNLQELKVRFTVAEDAKPGVRDFRLATPQGASTLGQLVIVRDPVVKEAAKNDTASQAQEFAVPGTVCGAIEKAEDVDFYKFQVEAGTALNFHVQCMRLQDRIHDLQQHADPILTIRNASGVTLASSDNFFFGDPAVDYVFPQAGEYLLEIRDVRYQGNKYWQYSIEVNDRPLVTNVYPLGVAAGEPAQLELIGFRLPETPIEFTPPSDTPPGPVSLQLPLAGDATNPAPLVISDLPLVAEAEGDNNTHAAGQPLSMPAGVNGRIESEADVDCFTFEAKKGETFSFEVIARRQQSSLDAQLRIVGENDRQYQLNDDMRIGKRNYSDSLIENWSAPADGKYSVEIRDIHLRGGPSFVYFIQATRSEPAFNLFADTDKTQLTPGTSGALFVRVERKNGFDGEVQLSVEGLPETVTASCGRILAGKGQDGCIVLTAAGDAPLSLSDLVIKGTAVIGEGDARQTLTTVALPYQETYQPGGGRGHWPVDTHVVSVGAPSDLRAVTLSEYDITLKPGESKQIEVTIERAEGFDKNVTLDLLYRHLNGVYGDSLPQGVTIDAGKSKTLLTAGAAQGVITLKAADDAPAVEKQQAVVMANIALNFVMKATYASRPLTISVVED